MCVLMTSYIIWLWAMNFSRIPFWYVENGDDNIQLACTSEEFMACTTTMWRVELSLCYLGSEENLVSLSWGLQSWLTKEQPEFKCGAIWGRNRAWNSGLNAQLNALSSKTCLNFLKQKSLFVATCNLDLLLLLKAYIQYFLYIIGDCLLGRKKKSKKATHIWIQFPYL